MDQLSKFISKLNAMSGSIRTVRSFIAFEEKVVGLRKYIECIGSDSIREFLTWAIIYRLNNTTIKRCMSGFFDEVQYWLSKGDYDMLFRYLADMQPRAELDRMFSNPKVKAGDLEGIVDTIGK